MSSRQIFKGRMRAEHEVESLLQTIIAAELIAPSKVIWLISPWISDVEVLDNRAGAFSGIEPRWGRRQIVLSDALSTLVRRGSRLVIATRPVDHNLRFVQATRDAVAAAGLSSRLLIHQDGRESLHEKGLLGDDYCVSGSMNFTESGIRFNDETVTFELDQEIVSRARLHYRQHYGEPST
jgi:phosphatidylserine/phosphatidylglycerophosphate/cardiolipin synthase-like enzyme